MNKTYVKKYLAVAVILLFFSVSVIPSTDTTDVKQITVPTTKGDTLYVGGNGTGNYSKIQDAVDDANNGDTVYVYDDSSPYYEYLEIEKSINLIGENKNTTIIDGRGGGNVNDILILILDGEVKVSGFTLNNSYYGIWVGSNSNTISDNNIHHNIYNLHLYKSHNNLIQNNNISSGNFQGILLFPDSTGNVIINNYISKSQNGIAVCDGSHNNIITNNIFYRTDMNGISVIQANYETITGNTIEHGGTGVNIFLASNHIIENNYIANGSQDGIATQSCRNTVIRNNTILNHLNEGISLETHQETAYNHTVCNNLLINNKRWGIYLRWAKNNLIHNNTVINSTYGIRVASDYFSEIRESASNVIRQNTVSNNEIGIYLQGDKYDEHIAFVKDNDIYNNIINNNEYGMYLTYAKGNLIYHNNFYNNTDEQAYDDNVNSWYYPLVNEGNYWSDFDEPSEGAYDANGDGIVDSPYDISGGDNSDFYPLINPYVNLPPRKPSAPSGPISGKAGEQYTYTSNTTDPERDMIFYWFDWDDSTEGEWVGPFESGGTGSDSHTWREGEIYHVRVKAMDVHGEESPWSEPMQIQLTGPNVEIGNIRGGIGIKVQIMNIGDEDISLVKWCLKYNAWLGWWIFYPFDKCKEGVIPRLKAGETKTIWGFVFGYGNCVLTATAEKESVTQRFDILGPFVRIIR